jgi:hypothetical protein
MLQKLLLAFDHPSLPCVMGRILLEGSTEEVVLSYGLLTPAGGRGSDSPPPAWRDFPSEKGRR